MNKRLFPANAGVIPRRNQTGHLETAFPRQRGGDPGAKCGHIGCEIRPRRRDLTPFLAGFDSFPAGSASVWQVTAAPDLIRHNFVSVRPDAVCHRCFMGIKEARRGRRSCPESDVRSTFLAGQGQSLSTCVAKPTHGAKLQLRDNGRSPYLTELAIAVTTLRFFRVERTR